MLVKYWSNTGQILVKATGSFARRRQLVPARCRILVQYWSNTGQTLLVLLRGGASSNLRVVEYW
jgi:hypothetical protein